MSASKIDFCKNKFKNILKDERCLNLIMKMIKEKDEDKEAIEEANRSKNKLFEKLEELGISKKWVTLYARVKYLRETYRIEPEKYERGYWFEECVSSIKVKFAVLENDVEFVFKMYVPFGANPDPKSGEWDDNYILRDQILKNVVYAGDKVKVKRIMEIFNNYMTDVSSTSPFAMSENAIETLFHSKLFEIESVYTKCDFLKTEKVMREIHNPDHFYIVIARLSCMQMYIKLSRL